MGRRASGRLDNPPRKKRRPIGGQWQPDLFGGAGIQRREGLTRAEQLELAREEMRDVGARDLFDLVDQDRKRNPRRMSEATRRVLAMLERMPSWQVADLRRRAAAGQLSSAQRAALRAYDAGKTARERNPARRYRVREIDPNDPGSTRTLTMSEDEIRDEWPHWGGKPVFTTRDYTTVRVTPVRRRQRRDNPADTPAVRYQRAIGHGERRSTAEKAAANPGRATGRMAPNCPMCGALVRLRNPIPPRVTCHACGAASLVRRP